MKKCFIPLLAAACIAICLGACSLSAAATTEAERPIVERIRTIRKLRARIAERCWPGFDAPAYDAPLLYYTDSVCYAVAPGGSACDSASARLLFRDRDIAIRRIALLDPCGADKSRLYTAQLPPLEHFLPEAANNE